MDTLAQWWIGVFGIAAIFLVNMKDERWRRWGPVMGMVSQPGWFYVAWDQWGVFIVCVFYLYSWLMGVYNGWVRPYASEAEAELRARMDQ